MAPEKSPSKEKILQIKRDTLKIVEALLEEEISKEWFLQNCSKLCQADYDDVVQERSIAHQCGYPLCSNPIEKVPRQQFKISKNKVYDISERKNFCSNECYKASNFLKAQLHSLPLWLRKPEKSSLELKLLLDSENKGSAGEELLFKYSLSKTEVEQNLHQEAKPIPTMNLNNMLQEDIKDCTEHLDGLNIKENVYKEKFIFSTEVVKDTENSDEETLSDSQNSNSDDDKPSFPEYGNIAAYSNKHMPTILGKGKRAVLIPQLRAPQEPTINNTQLPIDYISKVFQDWYSEDTLKCLFGERQLYSIKADHLFKTLVNSTDSAENISSVKEEYVNLCLKIDQLPDEEEEDEICETFDTDICDVKPVEESASKQKKMEKLASDLKLEATKTNLKRKVKRKSKGKNVSFASGTKPSKPINLPEESESTLPEPTLPLIDSLSQGIRRKQILTASLKNMFAKILPIIDLHYNMIKKEVADLVDTFNLTPTNTVLKPKQLKCVAVVIFLLLTKTKLTDLYQEAEFTKLCEHALTSLNISQKEVEDLVLDLVSPNQVLKLL